MLLMFINSARRGSTALWPNSKVILGLRRKKIDYADLGD
jgi:hypothetical protein